MPMASRAAAAAASRLRAAASQQRHHRRPSPAAVLQQSRSAATAPAARLPRGDYVPVYVALGLVALAVTLGLSTAKQQLAHAPNVRVDKKKRETVPEVAAPDLAVDEGERFVGRSLFRKVAHVQDDRSLAAGVADPIAEYPTKKAVTLKDVGVETPGIEPSREAIVDKFFKKKHA